MAMFFFKKMYVFIMFQPLDKSCEVFSRIAFLLFKNLFFSKCLNNNVSLLKKNVFITFQARVAKRKDFHESFSYSVPGKSCEACTRPDCRTCTYCRDMNKYGGSGVLKQTCKLKKCQKPLLPAVAVCIVCNLDSFMNPARQAVFLDFVIYDILLF